MDRAVFQSQISSLGIAPGELRGDALQLLREVVNQAKQGISIPQLSQLVGTGTHAGMFWSYCSWLIWSGILKEESKEFYVLDLFGNSLYEGFRAFGIDTDSYHAL